MEFKRREMATHTGFILRKLSLWLLGISSAIAFVPSVYCPNSKTQGEIDAVINN